MSVIVKGMEMPNACWSCEGCDSCDGETKTEHWCALEQNARDLDNVDIFNDKPDWCPLVEIPTPHGILIDERELYNKIESEFDGCCVYDVSPNEAVYDFEEIVDQCKTIIEAEE